MLFIQCCWCVRLFTVECRCVRLLTVECWCVRRFTLECWCVRLFTIECWCVRLFTVECHSVPFVLAIVMFFICNSDAENNCDKISYFTKLYIFSSASGVHQLYVSFFRLAAHKDFLVGVVVIYIFLVDILWWMYFCKQC